MPSDLLELSDAVCAHASGFDAGLWDRDGAEMVVGLCTVIINAADATRSMAAARVAECGAPAGSKDTAAWFAKKTGTSSAKAKDTIRTGKKMRVRSKTRRRATQGKLSPEQAAAITDAAEQDPAAEDRLVKKAETASLGELRDECARAKANADPDPAATQARIDRNRHLRRWRDREGAEHLHAVGTKADMAKIDQALAPIIDEIFKAKRDEGAREPLEAYAFDALVQLADGGSGGTVDKNGREKMRYLTLVRVDWDALTRGIADAEEICEIAGLGPIPVDTARALLGESILKLVITKGVDVLHVTHLGRGVNTAQQIALCWQQPVCTREGCGRGRRLENDHRDDWTNVKCTELDNIDPLCDHDHDLKTLHGWALIDGKGKRPMVPPNTPTTLATEAAQRRPLHRSPLRSVGRQST
ncbi:MAG: hypothetical protein QOE63_143 [Acidimicrobiaceae bacterium]